MTDAWGISWRSLFKVWVASEQITAPEFGEPFLDASCPIRLTLGASIPLNVYVTGRTTVSPFVERRAHFPSSRISRSVK